MTAYTSRLENLGRCGGRNRLFMDLAFTAPACVAPSPGKRRCIAGHAPCPGPDRHTTPYRVDRLATFLARLAHRVPIGRAASLWEAALVSPRTLRPSNVGAMPVASTRTIRATLAWDETHPGFEAGPRYFGEGTG
jgi:hypothetical protein